MLHITIPACELWDDAGGCFINTKEQRLQLEHSLVSLSKWESNWCKPFLSKETKTTEETVDYIKCMTITQNVDPNIYKVLPTKIIDEVNEYISSPMTATWFTEDKLPGKKSGNSEQITSELIYYWMIALNIPFKCEKWHLNRLLTLVRVCNVKNQDPKKMSKKELMSRNAALNAARRKQLNTKG